MQHEYSEIFEGAILDEKQAQALMDSILEGTCNEHKLAAYLGILRLRGLHAAELRGFSTSVLSHCVPLELSSFDPVDICGTGGDGKNTFNVSTLAAIVTAAAGYPVAKHGNYGASSVAGSSNVLEAAGIPFATNQESATKQMENYGICFLHAPLFHPALKSVAPVRKNLGFRSIFNLLGPLCNPARPSKSVLGVSSLAEHRLYREVLQSSERSYAIVFSRDGYDEVSLTGPCLISTNTYSREFDPAAFGLSAVDPKSLHAGLTIKDAFLCFDNILKGQGTKEQRSVVIANAAIAIERCDPKRTLLECTSIAQDALENGKALNLYKKISKR